MEPANETEGFAPVMYLYTIQRIYVLGPGFQVYRAEENYVPPGALKKLGTIRLVFYGSQTFIFSHVRESDRPDFGFTKVVLSACVS